ncbi:MAG: FprA family A-type flavoprotein, partial [Andreesenia angusta]|nr:FprA family A-type flavoprotein [Andreesenia angusta]
HGLSVQKLFKRIKDLEIKEIFPLHGLCFRDEDNINMVMEKYRIWSTFTPEDIGVVMVYGSMYGNSKEFAEELAILLAERGVKNIQMFDASQTEPSIIMTKLFRYSHAVFSIANYNSQIYFPLADLFNELVHSNYQNRKYALSVNKTWGGQAEKKAQELFGAMKNLEQIGETFQILSRRTPEQWDDLVALADAIADSIEEEKNNN